MKIPYASQTSPEVMSSPTIPSERSRVARVRHVRSTWGMNAVTVIKAPRKPKYFIILIRRFITWYRLSSRGPGNGGPLSDRQPIRPHPIPFLNQQPLFLEHEPDLSWIVSANLLENRD